MRYWAHIVVHLIAHTMWHISTNCTARTLFCACVVMWQVASISNHRDSCSTKCNVILLILQVISVAEIRDVADKASILQAILQVWKKMSSLVSGYHRACSPWYNVGNKIHRTVWMFCNKIESQDYKDMRLSYLAGVCRRRKYGKQKWAQEKRNKQQKHQLSTKKKKVALWEKKR